MQERLSAAPGVAEAIVYGVPVPGQDGKAGMAALIMDGAFSARAFGEWVTAELPAYAQPVFVRLLKAADTTGTFKYRKIDLVTEGFDPALAGPNLYFRGGRNGYQKLSPTVYANILAGTARF